MKISNKFYLEYKRCKKIIIEYNWCCASFLLVKKFLTSLSGFFIALIVLSIRPLIKIYLVRLNSSRMGHFSLSIELMLSEFEMNQEKRKGKVLLFYLRLSAANQQLLNMCKRSVYILPFPRLCFYIDIWLCRLLGEKYEKDFVKSFELNTALWDSNGLLKRTKPHLFFTQNELDHGKYLMEKFGLQSDAKFVCLLVRDHGYMNKEFPGHDYGYHTIRNADVQTYKKAALYLAEKGYYVLRMGKHVQYPFEVLHPRIIDYANHPLRSDFMDIYFSAHCYFFISTGSGLDSVACMFRRPKLITNVVLPRDLPIWYPGVFFIYKKIWDKNNKKYLTLENIMEIGMIDPNVGISQEILNQYNLELIHNTEDEILDAVCDMEAQLQGMLKESEEDRMVQKKFTRVLPEVAKNQHVFIKISPSFYKKGSVLFESHSHRA
ncbi:MAG TPA: TIGR04372 family glycosyltransferase [Gammaproteobacteria bacterium]|nr:TIGR04372 family glycosyltransferase [Gammaproteobacteria bacterium]